jgi:hypothetical protein
MRALSAYLAALLSIGAIMHAETVTFDTDQRGALPAGWSTAMTHSGGEPRWEVIADESAPSKPNVLAQLSNDKTNGRYPLAVYDRATIKDGDVSVRCKCVSGEVDQACGIVWRYRDPDNYYIVRANALENNVVLYKVEGGKRQPLPPKGLPADTYGVKQPVPAGQWNRLRVTFQGSLMTVFFNADEKLFEVEDETFRDGGKVGLWTKADSVTYFDAFQFDSK